MATLFKPVLCQRHRPNNNKKTVIPLSVSVVRIAGTM